MPENYAYTLITGIVGLLFINILISSFVQFSGNAVCSTQPLNITLADMSNISTQGESYSTFWNIYNLLTFQCQPQYSILYYIFVMPFLIMVIYSIIKLLPLT